MQLTLTEAVLIALLTILGNITISVYNGQRVKKKDNTEIDKIRSEIASTWQETYEKTIQRLTNNLDATNKELELQIERHDKVLDQIAKERSQHATDLLKIDGEMEDLEDRVKELENERTNLRTEILRLHEELKKRDETIAGLYKDLKRRDERIQHLQGIIDDYLKKSNVALQPENS